MAGFPGDMTAEEIKEKVLTELREKIAGSTDDVTVTVSPVLAAALIELLPEPKPKEDEGE